MGAFVGENYDLVFLLNKEFEEKEQELQRYKLDKAQDDVQYKQ